MYYLSCGSLGFKCVVGVVTAKQERGDDLITMQQKGKRKFFLFADTSDPHLFSVYSVAPGLI